MGQRVGSSASEGRRRGRPVGSDSAETRNRILKASRQVITERGYQAATFQAIAVAAELSRPTLHYYFASREEIYRTLIAESDLVVAECIAKAQRDGNLVERFSSLVAAIHEAEFLDRSQIAFLVSARLESTRNVELREHAGNRLRDYLETLVGDARAKGELPNDAAVGPIVEMLHAVLWGVGFYSGFVEDAADMYLITKQLDRLFTHGLLEAGDSAKGNSETRGDTYRDTPSAVGGPS